MEIHSAYLCTHTIVELDEKEISTSSDYLNLCGYIGYEFGTHTHEILMAPLKYMEISQLGKISCNFDSLCYFYKSIGLLFYDVFFLNSKQLKLFIGSATCLVVIVL